MVFEIVKCAALGDQRNEQNSCCNYRVRLFFLFYFFFFIFRLRIRQWKKAFLFQKKNIRDTRKRGSDTAIVMPIVRRVYLSYFWRPARPIFTVSFSFLIITPSGRLLFLSLVPVNPWWETSIGLSYTVRYNICHPSGPTGCLFPRLKSNRPTFFYFLLSPVRLEKSLCILLDKNPFCITRPGRYKIKRLFGV